MFINKSPARDLSLEKSKLNLKSSKNLKKGSLPLYMRRKHRSLINFKAVKIKNISLEKSQALNMKQGDILFIKIEDDIVV